MEEQKQEMEEQKRKMPTHLKDLSIYMDMTTTMATYLMAKSCNEEEVKQFFKDNRKRLEMQGFEDEIIDRTTKTMQDIIIALGKAIRIEETSKAEMQEGKKNGHSGSDQQSL